MMPHRLPLGLPAALLLVVSATGGLASAQEGTYRLLDRRDFAPGVPVLLPKHPATPGMEQRDGGVLLAPERPALTVELPVAAGVTNALIVRARAVDGNPFNWIDVESGGEVLGRVYPCIDRYVNTKVLLRPADTPAQPVTLRLREGPGCVIESLRAYEARLAYAIPALHPLDSRPTASPRAPFAPSEAFREAACATARWLFGPEPGVAMSGIRGVIKRTTAWTPDAEAWAMMIGRVLAIFETPELLAQKVSNLSFETRHPILYWDAFEERDDLTDAWRLETVNTLYLLARASFVDWAGYGISRYYRGVGEIHPEDAKTVDFGRNPYRFTEARDIPPVLEQARAYNEHHPYLAHNHMLWPALSLDVAAAYFERYGLPEAPLWRDCARHIFGPMLRSSKPMEDCSGYQIHAMNLMIEYARRNQHSGFFAQDGPLYRFFDLVIASTNNRGDGPGYGDVSTYPYTLNTPGGVTTTAFDAVVAQATVADEAFRAVLGTKRPDDYLGLYVVPLEPVWYAYYADRRPKEREIPVSQRFDKISFRGGWGAADQYLLLDGLATGYHNHIDGNAIVQFDQDGRTWLVERGYHGARLRDADQHNLVTVDRPDAPGGVWPNAPVPFASALLSRHEDAQSATVCTASYNVNGTDWTRQVYWQKGRFFVVLDRVIALEDGPLTITCRWRTLGKVGLEERRFEAVQRAAPAASADNAREPRFAILNADGSDLRLTEGAEPPATFAAYPYADPTVQVLEQVYQGALRRGESRLFRNVFGVVPSSGDFRIAADDGPGGDLRIAYGGEVFTFRPSLPIE